MLEAEPAFQLGVQTASGRCVGSGTIVLGFVRVFDFVCQMFRGLALEGDNLEGGRERGRY